MSVKIKFIRKEWWKARMTIQEILLLIFGSSEYVHLVPVDSLVFLLFLLLVILWFLFLLHKFLWSFCNPDVSLIPNLILVKSFERLLGELIRSDEICELISKQIRIFEVNLLHQVQSIHLQERWSYITPDVSSLRIKK